MHFLTKIVTFKHFICIYQLNFVTLQSILRYIKVTTNMAERKQRISAPPILDELRLDELMTKAGMKSLQELADRMGIERASLSRSLNGTPTYAMLYTTAEDLGVKVQTSKRTDQLEQEVLSYLEDSIYNQIEMDIQTLDRFIAYLKRADHYTYQILKLFYAEGETWVGVADKLPFSESTCRNRRDKVLEELVEWFN